jgi:hypothetical protein
MALLAVALIVYGLTAGGDRAAVEVGAGVVALIAIISLIVGGYRNSQKK